MRQIASGLFEYEDRFVFNEDSGQPTSIDIIFRDGNGDPILFVECKLAEKGFGGCSIFSAGKCDGQNPLPNKSQCYLHSVGRAYWDLIEKYGFAEILLDEQQCVFVSYYQFFREVLFAFEKGGIFLVLSDERNPVFHYRMDSEEKGLLPILLRFVPEEYKSRILAISIQELVAEIKKSRKHQDWIDDFATKYGLTL